jgi:hypothetical protein
MATGTSQSRRSRMDEFLPGYDFHAAYEISINAPPSLVYQCMLHFDFYAPWIVRLLMSLRTGRRIPRGRPQRDLLQRFAGSGFVVLAHVPGEELVIGVAGKFWHPDGGRCLDLRGRDFVQFFRPGYARAIMNFALRPESLRGTVLSTETRIKCCDRTAWWKFCLYWALIPPFSGVIRKAILKQAKAEAAAEEAKSLSLAQNARRIE